MVLWFGITIWPSFSPLMFCTLLDPEINASVAQLKVQTASWFNDFASKISTSKNMIKQLIKQTKLESSVDSILLYIILYSVSLFRLL